MMRRLWLLALAVVILPAFPAHAKTGPGNSWTQLDNHNWYPGSSVSPNCSPCVKWPQRFYDGQWQYNLAGNDFFHTQAVAAMDEWSGQQYPSPIFEEGPRGCGGHVCITVASLDPKLCGNAPYVYDSSHIITRGVVNLNSNRFYTDGPASDGACNVRWLYRHEIGHVFSEGHSSVKTDLMNGGNNKQEHVDADAQAELEAVYGTFGTNGGGPSGCNSQPAGCDIAVLKTKLLAIADSLSAVVTNQSGFPAGAS